MNHLFLPLLFLFGFTACDSSNNGLTKTLQVLKAMNAPATPDSVACAGYAIQLKPGRTLYSAACQKVRSGRGQYVGSSMDSISHYFTESYLNTILPYWYGTVWSFEGHTTKPREGEIACSYFVSTTLQQMGLNINRYKVAQLAPYPEALSYAAGDTVFTFNSVEHITGTLKSDGFGEGFYFLGMAENHVGLLLKRKGELFFIHSNYIDGKTVIELADSSAVFNSYTTFYVANMSHNEKLLRKWVSGEVVSVVEG